MLPLAAALGQTPAKAPTATPAAKQAAPAAKPATQTSKPAPAATQPAVAPTPAVDPAAAVSDDAVVMTVGNEKITKADWEKFLSALPDRVQAEARGPNRRKVAEQLSEIKALSQEAQKRKLDQDPKVLAQLNLQRDNVLAAALYQDLVGGIKTDETAERAYYQAHQKEFETATARHILVRMKGSQVPLKEGSKELTEQEALAKAQELRKKILDGADFAVVAKAESDDTGSGANGGTLGTFGHGQMVPAFEQAAFAQPVGQVSEPLKTQFGYHLVLVDERKAKTFEEAKPEIEKQMKPEMARKAVESVRDTTGVTINESYFGK